MLAQVNTCGLIGIEGYMVKVEADIGGGLPRFDIVGLPDAVVKESKERVHAAIRNSGLGFPNKKLVINLAPASLKKEGSGYDLSIAVAVILATNQLRQEWVEGCIFIGELSLDGSIYPSKGVLPMVIEGFKEGYKSFFVPEENAAEAAAVKGADIYPIRSLRELYEHLAGIKQIEAFRYDEAVVENDAGCLLDFAEVKGQENVKRALEIAAAGNHNILLIGPPGTGKTMLAQRIPGILPDMTFDEALEVTKIHSIAGLVNGKTGLIKERPFRSPHHSVSSVALSGGGTIPRPGELSLAHNGVLFLDELPEFKREALEAMRQPLEDGNVTISRVNATVSYPCNMMLVASMNPCKCGYFGDTKHRCSCTPSQIDAYRSKISGPLLDRIDIQVEVASVDYEELSGRGNSESSADIKKRVNQARAIQMERYKDLPIYSNSQLSAGQIEEYCPIGKKENEFLGRMFEKLGLSARAYSRILKVARTIADIEGDRDISLIHISEAVQYRSLDRKYFE